MYQTYVKDPTAFVAILEVLNEVKDAPTATIAVTPTPRASVARAPTPHASVARALATRADMTMTAAPFKRRKLFNDSYDSDDSTTTVICIGDCCKISTFRIPRPKKEITRM